VLRTAEPPIFATFTPFPGGEGVALSWQVKRCIELVEMPVETLSKWGRGMGREPATIYCGATGLEQEGESGFNHTKTVRFARIDKTP